jgi:SOS response regulatory protein OraA/RecX
VPRVTALRERRGSAAGAGTVAVELDGAPWRTLPADVVVRAGLVQGVDLDRERLRTVRRELRRAEALGVAVRALRHADRSRAELSQRLSQRKVLPAVRDEALEALERAGYVDDTRAAASRAGVLAERGYGDDAVRHDLLARGFAEPTAEAGLGSLPPERQRVAPLVARRGASLATARWLAGRGFAEDTIESALPGIVAPED